MSFVSLELPQPMLLLWHASRDDGHYLHNHCRAMADALDELCYLPTTGSVRGACRRVLDRVAQPGAIDAYVSGDADFVATVRRLFVAAGVPADRVFSEAPPAPRSPCPPAD